MTPHTLLLVVSPLYEVLYRDGPLPACLVAAGALLLLRRAAS